MRFVQLLWVTKRPGRAWVGSVSNKHNPSTESGLGACISSRITTVIHVKSDHQINYNCFNEPFAVSPYRSLYWDMHGLIFETSIWLLAGSTRLMHNHKEARQTQSRMSRNPCGTSSETQFQHIQRTAVGTLITIKTYTMTPELPTPRHSKEVQGSRSIPGYCMLTCSAVRSEHSSQGTPRFKSHRQSRDLSKYNLWVATLNTSHSPTTDLTHISWWSCEGLQRYMGREIMHFSWVPPLGKQCVPNHVWTKNCIVRVKIDVFSINLTLKQSR